MAKPTIWGSIGLVAALSLAMACQAAGPGPAAAPTKPPAEPAAAAPTGAAPQAFDPKTLSGTVSIDGSSTVFPISEAMAEEFQKSSGGRVRVTVGISGTGGGFRKFCAGETDISDASRPISRAEIEACNAQNIRFVELPIAFDGLSVMVSPRNNFVESMSVTELKTMWQPEAQGNVTRWSQVRPDWPDRPFKLYGAGTDSGTFDYFTEAINGKEKASRGDYTASEDDNVLVQGISNDPDALGYFGYAYYEQNQDKLKLVKIDGEKGGGAVAPSPETISNGSYVPLSRPIFIYAKLASLDRPEVREFVRFYLTSKNATTLIPQVGYVPLPDQYYVQAMQRLEEKQVGTVFPAGAQLGIKVDELFKPPTQP
jgi:phosphate transport system substrate-binding protein